MRHDLEQPFSVLQNAIDRANLLQAELLKFASLNNDLARQADDLRERLYFANERMNHLSNDRDQLEDIVLFFKRHCPTIAQRAASYVADMQAGRTPLEPIKLRCSGNRGIAHITASNRAGTDAGSSPKAP